jgi:hypothetical protein
MAAISNQSTAWKQAAMQRAEKLTDYWDIVKAWAGRSAEIILTVCMFVSLVGMLPGVHYWSWVSNAVLAVQMIMLDFGGFALHTLAEHARDSGQDEAARKAERMADFLIGLVIVTLAIITVGQLAALAGPFAGLVSNVVKYAEPVLILVRVVSSVKYIHVIHSLRGSTQLAIQPTQVPTQPAQDELAETLASLTNSVATMAEQISSIQQPTHISEIVEAPIHDLHTDIKPLQMRIVGASTGLHLLTMAATATDTSEDVIEDAAACEAVTQSSEQISYPDVPGVSAEKVRSIIEAFESGTKWRAIPGNYSQTVKPVREAWESLHSDLHTSIQTV